MRLNFKKISAIAASTLMVGLSMGVAAAANYPQPFVVSGAADVAVVYGTGSGVSSLDLVQAGNIQSNLQSFMTGGSGTTATGEAFWEVGTSSDDFELTEHIGNVTTYIDSGDLSLLANGKISNEKGDAEYKQYLYFDETASASVLFTEDDDDNQGLFFKINSGHQIARYVMDFSTNLKSDIVSGEYEDIEDKDITFLGKTYTIVDATNGSAGAELILMSGALGGTVTSGESLTVDGYTVGVQVISSTEARFTVTTASGTETTSKMNKGEMERLSDDNYLAVTDIDYQGYAGGVEQATFYIGADKIEWKNGTDMTVNGETINEAGVIITSTESSADISISEIEINMTAEDDLYVPVNGKLSEATDLDEPEVLVSQNWDIEFKGLEATDYENISLKATTDNRYTLKYKNYAGVEVTLPLLYTNATGVFGGKDANELFILNPTGKRNVTKKDYFLLHTADPQSSTSNAKTLLVQYMGSDKVSTTTADYVNFKVDGEDKKVETTDTGTFVLNVAGSKFNFANASTGANDDFDIYLTDTYYADGAGLGNCTSIYIRTYYNTLINITDNNMTLNEVEGELAAGDADWLINVTIDDGNRDGDYVTVTQDVFGVVLGNTSTDASSSFTGTGSWLTDNDESTIRRYITAYGAQIVNTNPSDSPDDIEVAIPTSVVKPLVYVSDKSGVSVSGTTGGTTQLGDVLVKDSEVSSVSSKNLIVVGGSCINSAAAKLVGTPACSSDFTTKTGIGSGQFLIQSFGDAYTTGKVALLVAGYEASDTVNAATYLRTQTVDTTAGKKYKGTSSTSAELVVE
ncbi:hypothetical protein A3K74_02820 [Candidatus Pacearchaeota archaeon RBG_13_33_26]|nr:MAG: hypothetical protein A3K74_02820 [Candidatus Pacearchaeota archaeon RBG_13_33_26]